MRINGEWSVGLDRVSRPMVCTSVRDQSGTPREVVFLVDTGADQTVLDFDTYLKLGLESTPNSGIELEGVGGTTSSVVVDSQIRFLRDDGGIVVFNAEILAFTEPTSLGMNVLGRDILRFFAVIVDAESKAVCLLREPHHYVIQES